MGNRIRMCPTCLSQAHQLQGWQELAIFCTLGQQSNRYRNDTNRKPALKTHQKNTQQTNIRMTHIFSRIGLSECKCFYVTDLDIVLDSTRAEEFIEKLKTWDKQYYLRNVQEQGVETITIPVEKYLLVNYASEHLELPPLNNRM